MEAQYALPQQVPTPQAFPHSPQLSESFTGSTHWPLHQMRPSVHSERHSPPEQQVPSPQTFPHAPQLFGSFWVSTQVSPHRTGWSPEPEGQHPGGYASVVIETGWVDPLLTVSSNPPGCAELVTRKTVLGGLKNVIRLDVKDADDTVTSVLESERPGTENGPRLAQIPSLSGLHWALEEQAFCVMHDEARTW